MEIYLEKQLLNIVYSLILGLIFGAIYDIIRIIHILLGISSYSGEKRGMKRGTLPFLVFFMLDTVFVITVSAIYSFFNYVVNNGAFRVYFLIAVCVGFFVYYSTFGRIVMFFSETLVTFLKRMIFYTVVIPARFVLRLVMRVVEFAYRNTFGRLICILVRLFGLYRTDLIRRHLVRDIRFRFKDVEEAK